MLHLCFNSVTMIELKQPTSIRWKKDRMDFVRNRENLDTAQKVVTFLLEKYYWEYRDVKNDTSKTTSDSQVVSIPDIQMSALQEYLQEINSAHGVYSIKSTVAESEKDNRLSLKEKEQIKFYGIQKSKEIDV